jgi:hypothetical protein
MADTTTTGDKLDKIIRVVTRTEVQVEALMKADAHTRLTKLEAAHKFWKAVAIAFPSIGGLIVGLMRYFNNP